MFSRRSCGCYLILVSVAIVWAGAEGFYIWVTNRQPMEIPCTDFEPRLVEQAKWFRLTDCEVDLTEALYFENRFLETILEVFIPIQASTVPDAPVFLLVSTRDHKTLRLVRDMMDLRGEELEHYVRKNQELLVSRQTIEGMMRIALKLDEDDRRALTTKNRSLAEGFKVLDLGQKPTLRFLFVLIQAPMVLLLGLALLSYVSKVQKRKDPIADHAEHYQELQRQGKR